MTKAAVIDVNCDLGEAETPEGVTQELRLLPFVTSINVACGGHAGNADGMRRIVAAAIEKDLAIGAHPGFPDRVSDGRQEQHWNAEWISDELGRQLGRLQTIARELGASLTHVKPHEALYNMAARDRALADTVASTIRAFDRSLILVGLAGSELLAAGRALELRVAAEGFADRAYDRNGRLIPRRHPGALITEETRVIAQALSLARDGLVQANDGRWLSHCINTLCLHGDTPDSLRLAQAIHAALQSAGVIMSRIHRVG